ncbi:MAG: OmpH family outer membrane protein [Phycisphaerales bacterium]|jgi:Skp family chaperone for outer membrane proteins
MNPTLPRFGRTAATALAMLVAGSLLALAAFAPQRPAVVASVDLERVFNSIDLQAKTEARLKAVAADLDAQRKTLRDGIEELNAELESFQPGSAAQLEVATRIEEAIAEFRAFEGFARAKAEAEQAKSMRQIYMTIREAAMELAKERGWDYVMVDDSIPTIEPTDSQRMLQQISSRRFLYANPSFDVTDDLIAKLNAMDAAEG